MTRARPPNRRRAWRIKFQFPGSPAQGFKFFGTVSYFGTAGDWLREDLQTEDYTRPREVFINSAKTTSGQQLQASAAAIYASFALQHGTSLDDLIEAGPKLEDKSPADPVGAFLIMVKAGLMLPPELRPRGALDGAARLFAGEPLPKEPGT